MTDASSTAFLPHSPRRDSAKKVYEDDHVFAFEDIIRRRRRMCWSSRRNILRD